MLTGDLFDEGKWCSPEEFAYYVSRFESLFHVDPARTRVHVMAGNHDIGFHYAVSPYLDSRFRKAFHTESVELKELDNGVPVITINSVAFEGDSCFLCTEAVKNLQKVVKKLKVTSKSQCSAHLNSRLLMIYSPGIRKEASADVPLPPVQKV